MKKPAHPDSMAGRKMMADYLRDNCKMCQICVNHCPLRKMGDLQCRSEEVALTYYETYPLPDGPPEADDSYDRWDTGPGGLYEDDYIRSQAELEQEDLLVEMAQERFIRRNERW